MYEIDWFSTYILFSYIAFFIMLAEDTCYEEINQDYLFMIVMLWIFSPILVLFGTFIVLRKFFAWFKNKI